MRRLRTGAEYLGTRLAALRGFHVDGERLPYWRIPFRIPNEPWSFWRTERVVEITLLREFTQRRSQGGLELGNVSHLYFADQHRVIDKYEQGPRVENIDVMDLADDSRVAWIMSCSTLEHIGWDEATIEPAKVLVAVEKLLRVTPRLFVTIPLGYNPNLDDHIRAGKIVPTWQAIFVRRPLNRWTQVYHWPRQSQYDFLRGQATAIWVGEWFEDGKPTFGLTPRDRERALYFRNRRAGIQDSPQ